jgi:hypothetical protein
LTISGTGKSSEELDLGLPAGSGAPKSTIASQRETTPRLRECQPAASARRPAPKDRTRRRREPVDPRGTRQQAVGTRRWSEDRLSTPRACARAPGPFSRRHRRVGAPRDTSAKEANTSRPCGPVSRRRERQSDPKASPASRQLASRSRELAASTPTASASLRRAARQWSSSGLSSHGSGHTKRCTTVGLRRTVRQHAASHHAPKGGCSIAPLSPPAPEGTGVECGLTASPPTKTLCRTRGPPRRSEEHVGGAPPGLGASG